MKIHIIIIVLSLLLIACKQEEIYQDRAGAVIDFHKAAGGFSHAMDVHVEARQVTVTVYTQQMVVDDGFQRAVNVVENYSKPLSESQFIAILDSYQNTRFFSLNPEYTRSSGWTDGFSTEFTLSVDGKTKRVRIAEFHENTMPRELYQTGLLMMNLEEYARSNDSVLYLSDRTPIS